MEDLLLAIINRLEILDLKIANLNNRFSELHAAHEDADTLGQSADSTRQAIDFVYSEMRQQIKKALP